MENKTINNSVSNNGISLQLHSKEVSEVMGKIPGWIGSWGALLICLLFAISILYVVSINSVQRISGKAIIEWQERSVLVSAEKSFYLQVVIPHAESTKIRKNQHVTFLLTKKNNGFNNLNGLTFSIIEMKTYADSCVLKLSLNHDLMNNIKLRNESITHLGVECQLETNIRVYKKMLGL